MSEEPGHDLVVAVTQMVVGAFGVRPSDGAEFFEALVWIEDSGDSISDFGGGVFVLFELEIACGVNVWY